MVTTLMLSFIGIPLTVGFTGKFFIFFGAISVQGSDQGPVGWLYPTLAVFGVLNAAVGAWYYLRIITVMYLRNAVKPIEAAGASPSMAALALCVVLTLALSIPPGANWMMRAVGQTTVSKRSP